MVTIYILKFRGPVRVRQVVMVKEVLHQLHVFELGIITKFIKKHGS